MNLSGNYKMRSKDYNHYWRSEWEMFVRKPARAQALLDAVSRISITCVLDIGCGAGQEMLPFVSSGAFGVGVDIAPGGGVLGRELFTKEGYGDRVAFTRGSAEQLPFHSGSFDLLVCRLALPYTANAQALAEMSRVLKPNGVMFLKIHHARFYLDKLWRGLLNGEFRQIVHAVRVMVVGVIYHVTGRQIRYRLIGNETFQTRWLLKKSLARNLLCIVKEMPDSNPRTPSFVVVKNATSDGKAAVMLVR
jgi:ubiquinone/menaquinone biosynthesis C-methylase UbiE